MGILDGIVEWIAEQVMAGLDLVTTSVLGALGCDMAVFLRYFPAAETMYSVFVALAVGIILLNWVWQLFKNFGLGAGIEAEDPVKLSIRSVIFILLALFSDEIVNIVLTVGGTPYRWIMDSELPPLSFADFNSVMLVIIGVCANGAVALITLILVIILAWNYLKLLLEAAERYVLLGVLVYTAPVAFSMGASQTTSNISSHHFGGGRSSSSTHVNANGGGGKGVHAGFGAGFASGGLAGVIKRNVTNNAVKTATTPSDAKPSGLGGLVGGAAGGIGGHIYSSSVSKGGDFANHVVGSVATGNITQMGTITGEKAVEALHSYMGHTALGPGAENIPTYQNVEIGGGRITGTEVTPEHPEGIAFGMYHADQYVAPEGQYTTVHAADGTAWYKQYAVDAVDKTPYMAPDGSIAYNESIVKKLPPTPKRKDKI